jgi:high-affinity iron transporter
MNAFSLALQSGAILLREGLEALLIIATLAALVRKADAPHFLRPIGWGAVSALVASLVLAVLFEIFLGGGHDDRIEAVTMLVAAGLMFYMSGWLLLRQDPKIWHQELSASVNNALRSGAGLSFFLISFLAVLREGAETLLFVHALSVSNGGWGIGLVGGLVAAALILCVLFYVMQWLALKLPLRPVFLVTSAFLFFMGLRFVGGAVQEMQEQAYLPYDDAGLPQWVVNIGANPTWEGLGVQIAVAALAIASLVIMSARSRKTAQA